MKGKFREELLGCFLPFYTGVALPIYALPTSFKLMALQNIILEEALLSKSVGDTMKQTSHPVLI